MEQLPAGNRDEDMPRAGTQPGEPTTYGVERLGALSDGVIAIGATLLVIDLKITPADGETLFTWARLLAHGPVILSWAISFLMIGVIWYEQHHALAQTSRVDSTVITMTLVQLALVSLIPFASSLIANYHESRAASQVFSAVMMANGLALAAHSWLIGRRRHLHGRPEAPQLVRHARYQAIAYPATAILAGVLSHSHYPLTGVAAWAITPLILLWVLARRLDHPATDSEVLAAK